MRNVAQPPATSFFTLFCTFVSKLVDADVSDLVAFVLSGGSIIGLNKDDAETQAARLDQGLESRERPINQGFFLSSLLTSPCIPVLLKEQLKHYAPSSKVLVLLVAWKC